MSDILTSVSVKRCGRSHRPHRRALTLLEVILVLAILAVVASLVLPALQSPLTGQRLRRSADIVRTAWAEARLDAMTTGRVHTFRCRVGTGEYAVTARAAPDELAATADDDRRPTAAATNDASETRPSTPSAGVGRSFDAPSPSQIDKLPEGITFLGGQADFDRRAAAMAADDATAPSPEAGWSSSVWFYPDGTCSEARVWVTTDRGRTIEVSLRGLTGSVQVGDVMGVEDVSP